MWRQVIICSLFGLVLVPDWATAFGFHRIFCHQPVIMRASCSPPVTLVSPPMLWYQPYPVCPTPSYGIPHYVIPATPMVPAPAPATPSPATSSPTNPPKVEAIPSNPLPNVPSRANDVKPAESFNPDPKPEPFPITPKPPAPGIPNKEKTDLPRGPQVELPLPNAPKSDTPELPKRSAPAMPNIPELKPPTGKVDDSPKIPPLNPPVPGSNNLPPLSVPGVGDSDELRISRSSPISARPAVNIYWVDGPAPESPKALRKVNFFNHTEQAIELKVAGKKVKVPSRHVVEFNVPQSFRWQWDNQAEQATQIPLASPGAEIVIRRAGL